MSAMIEKAGEGVEKPKEKVCISSSMKAQADFVENSSSALSSTVSRRKLSISTTHDCSVPFDLWSC